MKAKAENEVKTIEVEEIKLQNALIHIQGDTDLCLNRMNARTIRELIIVRDPTHPKPIIKQEPNFWEDVITAMHWRDGFQMEDTYTESTKEKLEEMLQNNAPCITSFGFLKSLCQTVTANEIDKYSTKFQKSINIVDHYGGLNPIRFAAHHIDKKLMSPKRGAPVLAIINRFSGWSASIPISITNRVYDLQAVVNIINLAGFGSGIGSGRTSGYGRYHVVGVETEE